MDRLYAVLEHRYEITAVTLFVIGLMHMMQQRQLVRKVIGFNIMDSAIFLLLTSRGFVVGHVAPMVEDELARQAVQYYVNPIPTGLVLTGIVVSVSVSAYSLALIQKIYREYGTSDIKELVHLVKREG
ncbi:MAG: cation:proton antiporter subunit C [Oscillospiraceae bacterium]|nr:cation:proton antiporter subunit C [Oscillospiraceae bacterium]